MVAGKSLVVVVMSLLAAPPAFSQSSSRRAGLELQALPPDALEEIREEIGVSAGVLVSRVAPASPAARAGLQAQDLILALGESTVAAPVEIDRLLEDRAGEVLVTIVRMGRDGEFSVRRVTLVLPAKAPESVREAEPGRPLESPAEARSDPRLAELQKRLKALEAAREAGVLTAREFEEKKAALDAELAALRAATLPPPPKGRVFRHPIGFSFGHPGEWRVQEQGEGLQLVPPNPAGGPEGPEELYLIVGDTVEGTGISAPDHPAVAEYLDNQIAALSPAFSRQGAPVGVPMTQGKGCLYEWRGRNPRGQEILARAYASILRGHGVALIAIGLPGALAPREQEVRRIFSSFGFGPGQLDRALVGQWTLTATSSLTNRSTFETDWSRAKMLKESQSRLVLEANGSWNRRDESHLIAGAGGVWLEDKSATVSKGKWYAGGGSLYLVWEDGTWEDYKYELRPLQGGRELRLVSSRRGEVWKAR